MKTKPKVRIESVYEIQPLSESVVKNFVPTRLYVKRHSITGMKYLGKYTKENILEYLGSGHYWGPHIDTHGIEHVVTDWVSDWYYDANQIYLDAMRLSKENDVVYNLEWANLIPESGLDGGCTMNGKISTKDPVTGKSTGAVFVTDPRYINGEVIPYNTGMIPVKHSITGDTTSVSKDHPDYVSGIYVLLSRKGEFPAQNKITGQRCAMSHDDPRWLLDEWEGVAAGPQPVLTCPKCGLTGGVTNLKRFHFENCGKPASHTGKTRTEEQKKKHRRAFNTDVYIWTHVDTGVQIIGNSFDFRQQVNEMTNSNTSVLIHNHKKIVKGWTVEPVTTTIIAEE